MIKISIIHPSRNRPALAEKVINQWLGNAARPSEIEYILSIDKTEPQLSAYLAVKSRTQVGITVHDNHTAIQAINNGAKSTIGNLIIVVSDDFECPKNWDIDLLKYLKDKEDFIVKTYDGLQPWIMTLPIMDRAYYERFGYIYPPYIKHMFADTWMSHVADLLDKKIIVPLTFKHKHYTQADGIKRDEVSAKNDNTWMQGEKAYLDGVACNFGLKDKDIKGVLRCDQSHLNWLKNKGITIDIS